MEKSLFDVNALPLANLDLHGRGFRTDLFVKKIYPFPVYEQFVSNGLELLILSPFCTGSPDALSTLRENNFELKLNEGFEFSCIAYRKTNQPDTIASFNLNIVICLMVCDLNSSKQIEDFYAHYFNQGIDKIFAYYTQPGSLSKRTDLPILEGVSYFDWPYTGWLGYPDGRRIHNCQTSLYSMFLNKIAPSCNWVIFCDLDEYIVITDTNFKTIKEYLNVKTNHLFTNHAIIGSGNNVYEQPNNIALTFNVQEPNKGKTIINGQLIKEPVLSSVHKILNSKFDKNLLMLHGTLP